MTRYESKDTKLASVEEDVTFSREHKTEHKKGLKEGDEGRQMDGIRERRGGEEGRKEGREEHKGTTL